MKLRFVLILACLIGCNQDFKADDLDLKLAGRARLVKSLRDPGSLEIISEELIKPGKNGATVGYEATFRAKNGFGGYETSTFYTE